MWLRISERSFVAGQDCEAAKYGCSRVCKEIEACLCCLSMLFEFLDRFHLCTQSL